MKTTTAQLALEACRKAYDLQFYACTLQAATANTERWADGTFSDEEHAQGKEALARSENELIEAESAVASIFSNEYGYPISSDELRAALEAEAAQVVKPIAWLMDSGDDASYFESDANEINVKGFTAVPLFTAPQEPAAPAWIAVRDRLPPDYEIVLVANQAGVTSGSYSRSMGWMWDELDDEPENVFLSHWMSLPPPPESKP